MAAAERSAVVLGADELTLFRIQRVLGTIGVRLLAPSGQGETPALAIVVAVGPVDWEAVAKFQRRTDTVVVSSEPNTVDERRALELGAIGYMPLHVNDEALSTRLGAILDGQAGFSRATLGHWLRAQAAHVRTLDAPNLTQRQRQILERIAHGDADKQIADHLGIATGTVQKHVHALLRRLNARNRAAAVRYARTDHRPRT